MSRKLEDTQKKLVFSYCGELPRTYYWMCPTSGTVEELRGVAEKFGTETIETKRGCEGDDRILKTLEKDIQFTPFERIAAVDG